MKIRSLQLRQLQIPFRASFKHRSADRKATQSILVLAETDRGALGMGEGCPREYVTFESIGFSLEFLSGIREEMASAAATFHDLERWVLQHELEIDQHPAAWCAMELALLDALSKDREQSIEKTISTPELAGTFQYTAVLGISPLDIFRSQLQQYAAIGFTEFKLKITGDPDIDDEKVRLISGAIPTARVRLDANNLWQSPEEIPAYLDRLTLQPSALEEPLQPGNYQGLFEIARTHRIPIILDESFLNQRHFACLADAPPGLVRINLRVSKMGGLLRSLDIARQANFRNIPIIVGAQVGETSILTRAALTVANACRGNLLAQEGAFGTFLLESDIVEPPLMFGAGGKMRPEKNLDPRRFGLQMNYTLDALY
jgi:L-Ala-D/L-Glu epimerase